MQIQKISVNLDAVLMFTDTSCSPEPFLAKSDPTTAA